MPSTEIISLSNLDKIVIIEETGLALSYILKEKLIPKQYSKDPWLINKERYFVSLVLNLVNLELLSFFVRIKRKINFFIFNLFFCKKKKLKKIFSIFPEITFDLKKTHFYNHHECHALSFAYFFKDVSKKYLV